MGRSGQLLQAELDAAGLTDVYITNIVKCRPPENRTPTNEEIKACRAYLDEEIEQVNPQFVVTLGSPAAKSVLKQARITESHGKLVDWNGRKGYALYHPAYVLRDPSKLPAFRADLRRLVQLINGTFHAEEVDWKVVTSESIDQFLAEFAEADEFAFDLETTGLFAHDLAGAVRCVGIALEKRAWVIPLNMPGSHFSTQRAQSELLNLVVDLSKGKRSIAQNGKFDNTWLMVYYGVKFNLTFDTGLAHHLIDEDSPHDLKSMARAYLNAEEYDIDVEEKKGNTTPARLYEYCAKDATYTLRLKKVFDGELRKDPALRKLFYKLVMPAARAFEDIELTGMTLDLERMAKVEAETRVKLDRLLKELNSMVKRTVNWNSPAQVAEVLFNDLGLVPTVLTDKGKPSTGEAALLEIRDEHPIATKLVEYRETQKFLSTYLEGWKDLMVDDTIYFSYKLHGTVTGRYSSRLHQVPRDGTIRNLVTAPEGWTFVQLDVSQAEVRTVAELSGDRELLRCFQTRTDVHWRTMIGTFEVGAQSKEYVDAVLQTSSMYCLRHKLPANGPMLKILHDVWSNNETGIETEILLEEAWNNRIRLQDDKSMSNLSSHTASESSVLSGLSPNKTKNSATQVQIQESRQARRLGRGWFRRESVEGKEPSVEGRTVPYYQEKCSEKLLSSLQAYCKARYSSQRRKYPEQPSLQFGDALSLLSQIGPSLAQELWTGWKEARKASKGTVFGFIYSMGAKKFVEYAKLKYGFEPTLRESERYREAFFKTYPSIPEWHNKQKRLAHLNGYVRNLVGRIRHLPGIHSTDRELSRECERQAINSPVQGFIGDFKAMALVEIHETFPRDEVRIVGEHHDAILAIFENRSLQRNIGRVLEIMRRPRILGELGVKLRVPMEADAEAGNWGAGRRIY